ncbi:MAG: hypothetical protein V7708_03430 [Oceanicoccus sp.]
MRIEVDGEIKIVGPTLAVYAILQLIVVVTLLITGIKRRANGCIPYTAALENETGGSNG